jgi:RNA polymerase sigma factor (sigma-70 family)
MTGNQSDSFDNRTYLITQIYNEYYHPIHKYIITKTNNHYLSEDLTQDVFIRLLDFEPELRMETIRYFVFTIARNILIDFTRRNKKQQVHSVNDFNEINESSDEKTESRILYKEILLLERSKFRLFPPQRKRVYCMSRYNEMTPSEISKALCISKRTVECYLFYGRKEMRDYISKCL